MLRHIRNAPNVCVCAVFCAVTLVSMEGTDLNSRCNRAGGGFFRGYLAHLINSLRSISRRREKCRGRGTLGRTIARCRHGTGLRSQMTPYVNWASHLVGHTSAQVVRWTGLRGYQGHRLGAQRRPSPPAADGPAAVMNAPLTRLLRARDVTARCSTVKLLRSRKCLSYTELPAALQ